MSESRDSMRAAAAWKCGGSELILLPGSHHGINSREQPARAARVVILDSNMSFSSIVARRRGRDKRE